MIFLVSKGIQNISIYDNNQMFWKLVACNTRTTVNQHSTQLRLVGSTFIAISLVRYGHFGRHEDALKLTEERISFHQKGLQQSVKRDDNNGESDEHHEDALGQNYWDNGKIRCRKGN